MNQLNKNKFKKDFISLMNLWIDYVEELLKNKSKIPELSNFTKEYIKILSKAKNQLDEKSEKIWEFYDSLEKTQLSEEDIFKQYFKLMSFNIEKKKVFLPSFSDEIFKEITKLSFMGLSPYRGVYYAWKLGEIFHSFNEGKEDEGITELLNLYKNIETDYCLQKNRYGNFRYNRYLNFIENPSQIPEAFKIQIELVKESLKDVIFPVKKWFLTFLPYPSKTSTHFYLSGLRFYWFPIAGNNSVNIDLGEERYYVQSTDSGIFKLEEHYGTLIDTQDPDAWKELMEKLPAGSLCLDLSSNKATNIDLESIKYFETWSYLVTVEFYHVISKTLNLVDMGFRKKGIAYFKKEIRKNPMRKFYFDTGIYRIAQMAKEGKAPKVSYLTTEKSKVPDPYFNLSKKLLEQFIDTGGLDYYLLSNSNEGWIGEYNILSKFTLIPSDNLGNYTNFLISVRDIQARKIVHGIESLPNLFLIEVKEQIKDFKIEDLIPGITILYNRDVNSLISFALPFVGRIIRTVAKIKDIKKEKEKIDNARKESSSIKIKKMNMKILKKET